MTPQISMGIAARKTVVTPYPSRDYRYTPERITGNVQGLDALKQSIYFILSTERYAYPIYGFNYGVNFKQYGGASLSYIKATIENTLKEALTQDDRITNVSVTSVEKAASGVAHVEFTVFSPLGTVQTEVIINA